MISLTPNQLAYQALRDLSCLRAGQTASPDLLADIYAAANQMLDAWLIDELFVPSFKIATYTLTAGGQFYLIGPGAANTVIGGVQYYGINDNRPAQIERANVILNTTTPPVHTPIDLIGVDDWAAIRVPQIPLAIPLKLYYDRAFDQTTGLARIFLWPGPIYAYQLEMFTWQQLVAFASQSTSYNFPPAYARAIQKNLAVEIAPLCRLYAKYGRVEKPDGEALELVREQARDAKANLQSYNAPDPIMHCDPAFSSATRRKGSFNYAIGE